MPLIFGSVEIKAHNLLYIMLRGIFFPKKSTGCCRTFLVANSVAERCVYKSPFFPKDIYPPENQHWTLAPKNGWLEDYFPFRQKLFFRCHVCSR